jgi:hypothetical protein
MHVSRGKISQMHLLLTKVRLTINFRQNAVKKAVRLNRPVQLVVDDYSLRSIGGKGREQSSR